MANYSQLLRSRLFTFHLGEDEEAIIVHAEVIAKQSNALNMLINGPMKEAQAQSAVIKAVTAEDFLRFCEFAYTGDYATPSSLEREEEVGAAEPETSTAKDSQEVEAIDLTELQPVLPSSPPPEVHGWGHWTDAPKKKVKKPSKTTMQRTAFDSQVLCPVPPRQKFMDACHVSVNDTRSRDYTPVLLAHSRLYVLADTYGVEELKSLCLQKLHKTLVDFEILDESTEDIAELVRYSYCDEHTAADANDALRKLVLEFVASRHEVLGSAEPFLSLLEEGGTFVRDFWTFTKENLI